ncbi:LysR family transcriptional regulator [Shewanella sp. VB17]|uniref:LysR family transcriptional regulator n=1 Tax=Shewanella sp. VB17 TaxID=2739432 RepID=UPI0015672A58|nr:LysR family transcriptional regulator [Shewanella sp. VB17]NRD74189.1 LysR family transcriptional regulator [Shewanella sp. VB17]
MIQFTFAQLTTFAAVCQHGSFAKAARVLGKDRSTLSEHVSNLEISLGVILFDRTSNSPQLTNEGSQIYHQAILLLRNASELEQTAINILSKEGKEFTISLDTTVPDMLIYNVNKSVSLQFVDTIFNWVHYDRDNAFNLLLEGEIDILIMLPNESTRLVIPPKGIGHCALGNLPGAFYSGANSPLQQLDSVSVQDLQLEKRYVLKNFVDAGLSDSNRFSNYQQIIDKEELLLRLLEDSGWAFLPKHLVKKTKNNIVELQTNFLNDVWQIRYLLLYRNTKGKIIPEIVNEIKNQFRIMASEN